MDFYVLLGVERQATEADIKRAYRRLARKYHPDINPGDRVAELQFRQIAEAYETLVDKDRRHRYDTGSPQTASSTAVTFGFEGFDFSMRVSGDAAPTFGDLFAEVFRQPGVRAQERGADLHVSLRLSFEQAMRGGTTMVSVTRLARCRMCLGAGRVAMAERPCQRCQGTGALKSVRNHMVFSKPCDGCAGTGTLSAALCQACGGRQLERLVESVPVNLPAGLQTGSRLRIESRGNDGVQLGPPGDLYVDVQVEPHPRFTRDGDDLHVTVPIAVHEAALGARIDVPSLDGTLRLRIPPGTQSGQRFRMREQGAPSLRNGHRGDLIVEVQLVLPAVLDERSKELLREFGRINSADVRQETT